MLPRGRPSAGPNRVDPSSVRIGSMTAIAQRMRPEDGDVEEHSREKEDDSENDHGLTLPRCCTVGIGLWCPIDPVLGVHSVDHRRGYGTTPLGRDCEHLSESCRPQALRETPIRARPAVAAGDAAITEIVPKLVVPVHERADTGQSLNGLTPYRRGQPGSLASMVCPAGIGDQQRGCIGAAGDAIVVTRGRRA